MPSVLLSVLLIQVDTGAQTAEFPWKPIKVPDLDCSKLVAGDDVELERTANVTRTILTNEETEQYVKRNCGDYLDGFITKPVTPEEEQFPIAYSVVVYKNPMQVWGLLRAIYRPQNFICIHVDVKSTKAFQSAVEAMVRCLDNVFLSSRSVSVHWGKFTVLEADLICMKDLLQRKGWKYFINLTGHEYPLRTSLELVSILKGIDGANLVSYTNRRNWTFRWQSKLPVPHNLTIKKGPVHVALNRHFVDYALNNPLAQDFMEWCSFGVRIPDEIFFSTLNYNKQLGIPGTQVLGNESDNAGADVIRFKNWWHTNITCAGKRTRGICMLSIGDLPILSARMELFANKFHQPDGIVTIECLAEMLYNRTRDEALGKLHFDVEPYLRLPFLQKVI